MQPGTRWQGRFVFADAPDAGGDGRAFEELYRRHKGGLFRFVLRSVRDRAVAEELYQEIWMRAIEARE